MSSCVSPRAPSDAKHVGRASAPERRLTSGPGGERARSAPAAGVPRFLQAKLAVSQPGDAFEQEADRIADHVMRMPAAALQRSCAGCASERCPSCATDEAAPTIQRKAEEGTATSRADTAAPDAGAGHALDAGARGFFEPRFGRPFADVRVHDDAAAHGAAQSFGARAYTLGSDLVFARGEYAPGTDAGRRLLAHELTHVVQQRGAATPQLQRAPDDAADADAAAAAQPADACHGRTLAEQEFDVFISAVSVQHGSAAELPMLYLDLKRTRTCFPSYSEADFLADVPEGALYSDEQRQSLASGQPKDVAADDRKLAWRESQKPFAGYAVSGFDASNRFTTRSRLKKFGYTPTASHPSTTELHDDASKAQKSFAEADVLVFSGHQYAQYQVPGLWGNDSGDASFDARTLAGPLNNVRLIVSTSCATLCRDPAAVWRKLFPNAVFLGYKKSAPLNGGTMARQFASNLPKDLLLDSGGVGAAAAAWKAAIRTNHRGDKSTQAGVLDVAANQLDYWTGSSFHSVAADSEDNQCRVKGDYSDDFPDPGTWNT